MSLKFYFFLFLEMITKWTISDSELVKKRGLATVIINHAQFPTSLQHHDISFILHGLINFNHCSFTGGMELDITGSQCEKIPALEPLSSFLSSVADNQIKIYKSQFRLHDIIFVNVRQTGRELLISHCDIDFNIRVKKDLAKKEAVILFSLQIEHGKVNGSEIEFLPLSFVHIKMINLNMLNVKMTNLNMFDIKVLKINRVDINCTNVNSGKISLHVENCSWVNSHRFMDLFQVISVSIVSSKLKTDCHSCSLMNVHGLEYWDYKDWLDYYGIRYLIKHSVSACSTLSLISTTFKVETSLNRIDTELVDIILTDTTFTLTESISFHLTKVLGAKNILIKCFIGQMAQRMIGDSSVTYTCNPKCEGKSEYSLQEGSLNVSEEIEYNEYGTAPKIWDFPAPLHIPNNPSCLPCPLGVNCKGAIQTMPNYWGYVTPEMSVSVVRCPDSYCCQGGRTCEGIDSCNAGRIGTLCGVCEQNSTEALFTPKCVVAESCGSGLVITLFISAALVYSIVLLSFSTVK